MFSQTIKGFFNLKQKNLSSLLLLGSGVSLYNYFQKEKYQCCGIIGVISNKPNQEEVLIEGIQLLQNRGYDSAGLATISQDSNDFTISKYASQDYGNEKIDCIEKIVNCGKQFHKGSVSGIAHTRWATCGSKTDANSHPHMDFTKSIAIVHNGTLENYEQLKEELINVHKVNLLSETDSELIAHILQIYRDKNKTSLLNSLKYIIEQGIIQGQWGLVALQKDKPDCMIVARRGSPIEIGVGSDAIYVASEKIAFQKYTSKFFSLNEGEIIELNLENKDNIVNDKSRIKTNLDHIQIQLKPKEPYSSFFEQELNEQSESLMKTLGNGSRLAGKNDTCQLGGLIRHQDQIQELDNLVVIACGTSYYASQYASQFLKQLQCLNSVQCIEGSEFCEYDIPMGKTGVVLVSQSGETADLNRALQIAKKKGNFSMGIINSIGSLLATSVDCGIYLNCGREVAVAATKSFTSSVAALIMMSIWISDKKDTIKLQANKRRDLVHALQLLPVNIGSTLASIDKSCIECAQKLSQEKTIICLGKGPCAAIAKEGALKLKELTYIHAEAFAAGELKHGPLALINPNQPKSTCIILIILNDDYINDMNLCLSEVHSRGALTIIITDCKEKLNLEKSDYIIEIQNAGVLTSLLCVLPFQKMACEMCKIMGIQIDKPRNLAKTVTTL